MRTLRSRVLVLVAGFGFVMAVLLATIMFSSVRGYYMDLMYEKSGSFVERVVEMHPNLWDVYQRYPEAFDIDMSRCMFCGLCEEACPEEAIVMSRQVEIAAFDRPNLVFDKDDLLVPEPLLKRRLDFLRAEYDRVHAPVEDDA